MRKHLFDLAKVLISGILLFALFRAFDFKASIAALGAMEWGYFIIALLLFQLSLLLRSFRWRFLLDALSVHVPLHRLLYLYYVGSFFNTFLPSGFGGDAVKMYELARYSRRASESVGTVFVDRLAGITMLFIMGLLAWPLTYNKLPPREAMLLLVASVGGLFAAWLLFRQEWIGRLLRLLPKRLAGKVQSLYEAVHTCGVQALWKALAVSALFNLALFGLNYALALALGVRVPFWVVVAFMPVLSLSMLLPSVGALGTREGAYVLLFGAAGVPQPVAMAMSLAFYVINVITGVIGGLLYATASLAAMRRA